MTLSELLEELEFELVMAQKTGNADLVPGLERCINLIIESIASE